ncbi:hypothetical protein KIW84_032971 [Lathyrus oleraceus]|uniref:beta-carotene 3-hydroxylase n=1 Tax=Pisum sativum TaxID=3888 RepID=A0A9D5B329_PEA|nr:hypothetical protein KIW84_032971 [Pisum sativum]
MSSFGVTSMAILEVYFRFLWKMKGSGEVLRSEMFATFSLSVGVAVGLGIIVFGIAYMPFHEGLVHKRLLVAPIANVPYFARVDVAHQLDHSDKFKGVPYRLFLGLKGVEEEDPTNELENFSNNKLQQN